MKKCKITVLKRNFEEELAKEYGAKDIGKCPLHKEGTNRKGHPKIIGNYQWT